MQKEDKLIITQFVFTLIILIITGFLLCSCATIPNEIKSDVNYKMDMEITINGVKAVGAVVAPQAPQYNFDIILKGKADLFTYHNCHRDIQISEGGQTGLFGDKKRVKFTFIPTEDMEKNESCPLYLNGYEITKQRHSFGLIEFRNPTKTLEALVKCSGEKFATIGVGICQAKVGTIQEISFNVDVINSNKGCPIDKVSDKVFRINMVNGQCQYYFEQRSGNKQYRLTTYGYSQTLIRSE